MLPEFKNSHFYWMVLCGEAPKIGGELAQWMKTQKTQIADFDTDRGEAHLRLRLGGRKSANHVHIDIFSPEITEEVERIDKPHLVDLAEIQNALSRFMNEEIKFNFRAGYNVTLDELPETGIIRAFSLDQKMGKVSIKLNGATFRLEGTPVQEISWNARPDGGFAVALEGEDIRGTVSDSYISDAVAMSEQVFNVFIIGKDSK